MASVSEIPWLRPARTLESINSGASAGSRRAALETSANEAAARNALEAQQQAQQLAIAQQNNARQMEQAKMEMDARRKVMEQQARKADQELKIQGAYRETQLGLQQQRLKQAEAAAQAKAQAAAREFSDRQKYSDLIASGVAPEKALFQVPGLMTAGTVSAAMVSARKPIPKLNESQYFANSPVMQKEEQDTQEQIRSGVPELKAIQDHPTLLDNPPYAQRWGPRFNQAKTRDNAAKARAETADAKANKPPNVSALANQRKSLSAQLSDTTQVMPKETKQAIKDQIFKIDTQLNGGKPPAPTESDIAHLKENPETRPMFEKYFGPADQYLTDEPAADEPPQ